MFSKEGMYSRVELVTPARAKALFSNQVNQRPINRAAVEDYKRQMKSGLWLVTHQSIAITKENKLADGQHRLLAIIELDVAVELYVTYNVDESAFPVFDVQRKRTAGDILGIAGFKEYSPLLAAISKLSLQIFRRRVSYTIPISNTEILEFTRGNADDLDYTLTLAAKQRFARSIMGAVHFTFAHVVGREPVDKFVEDVRTGAMLSENNPAKRLNNKFLEHSKHGLRLKHETTLGWAMYTANKYFLGQEIKSMPLSNSPSLRFTVDAKLAPNGLPKLPGV